MFALLVGLKLLLTLNKQTLARLGLAAIFQRAVVYTNMNTGKKESLIFCPFFYLANICLFKKTRLETL